MSKLVHLWKRLSRASAFEAVMALHMDRLWRLALRFQGNPDDAEDLLQELMARAWDNQRTILALDAPGPWMARVLYRLHVDRWRRRGAVDHSASLEDALEVEAALGTESVLDQIAVDEIHREVLQLPDHQRIVLVLHDGEGYLLEEIAGMVDAPVGTLKSRLHRARASIRARLSDGTQIPAPACQVGRGG